MGTELFIKGVTLCGVSKANLANEAAKLDITIAANRERLLMFAAATPRQIINAPDNVVEWEDHVQFEINQILDELEGAYVRRHLVGVALGDLDSVEESF